MTRLLGRILSTNYPSLLITYGLTLLENILELLYPLLIGRAIDDLLQQKYMGIIYLTSLWLLHIGIEVVRNIFDTITFTRIYTNLAVSVILEQRRKGVAFSHITARSALSREFVDFFEQDVPNLVTSIFGLIGSLVMLSLFDLRIVGYCLLIIIPVTLIQKFFIKKYLGFNYLLNNQLEKEVEILTKGNPRSINEHYGILAKNRIKLSNITTLNSGATELLIVALFMLILLRTTFLNLPSGDVYAVIAYAWNYRQSLDILPVSIQQLSRLKDIEKRLNMTA